MTYRLKNITCEALEVTESTTAEDFLAFGCAHADVAPSGGITVGGHDASNVTLVFPGMYVIKVTSPVMASAGLFEILPDATALAARYELIE